MNSNVNSRKKLISINLECFLIHRGKKCKFCNYMTKNTFLLKKHTLTEHSTKKERKEKFTYYCDLCDFGTFSKDTYEIHLNTNKHKRYNIIN